MSDSRSLVLAKPAGEQKQAKGPSIPIQMGQGPVQQAAQGVKMKSMFESGNSTAKMAGRDNPRPQVVTPDRPIVFAKMGQEDAPPAPPELPPMPPLPPTNVQEVLVRENGPKGLTKKEAADINVALIDAIQSSAEALSSGKVCVGVDGAAINSAHEIQAGLEKFSTTAGPNERLDLQASEIDLIDRMIACGLVYEQSAAASKSKTMAFVAGGLIIGTVVLLVMA